MIYSILKSLAQTSKSTEKLTILKLNSGDDLLREFFRLSLSPHINFYIRKIPEYVHKTCKMTLGQAMDSLSLLSDREYTGNDAIYFLSQLLQNLDPYDADVIKRIIKKDPNCGVAESTVNKVWSGLIPEFPNLLASKFDAEKLKKFPWKDGIIIQKKSDGARAYVIVDPDGNVSVKSRNGKELHVHGVFDYVANHIRGVVFDGELLVRTESGEESRQSGNGIVNKCNKGTATKEEANSLFLTTWDMIPYDNFMSATKYETPYAVRFKEVCNISHRFNFSNIEAIPSEVVYSFEDANMVYRKYVYDGFEGAIVKHASMIWEDARSKQQMKMKTVFDCDLECVGVTLHSKKEDQVGSLQFKSRDNKLTVSAGSGLSDSQRIEYFRKQPIGKVFKLEYNQKIQSEDGSWSLFLPIVIEERFDKDKADLFEDIQTL